MVKQTTFTVRTCPECGSTRLVLNHEWFLVCSNCGLVIEDWWVTASYYMNYARTRVKDRVERAGPKEWTAPLRKYRRLSDTEKEAKLYHALNMCYERVRREYPSLLTYWIEFEQWFIERLNKVRNYKWIYGAGSEEWNAVWNLFIAWCIHTGRLTWMYVRNNRVASQGNVAKWLEYLRQDRF